MNRLYRTVIAAGILSVAALSAASAAPFIVKDYYEDNGTASCGFANNCVVAFSAVPVGKSVVIGRVNCRIAASDVSTMDANLSALSNGEPTPRAQYFLPTALDPGENEFFLNEAADMFFGPGSRPGIQIIINTTTAMNERCQITGRLL